MIDFVYSVLTGPNCAGKSTYLRSVAVITILAHMGCYVPAAQAFIPLRDRILTRFGTSDDLEENASTFTVEMKETAFILEYATSKSLVLMDELGRGTQNEEGIAIAWAVSEELIKRKSYTCFATHYHDLHELACMYSSCHNYHMGTTATSVNQIGQMQYLYQLFDGPSPLTEMYGIQMASVCGLPAELIEDAKKIHQKLVQAKKKDSQQRAQQLKQTDQRMILSPSEQNQLADQIRAIFQANLEPHGISLMHFYSFFSTVFTYSSIA
jgi:DNA mismatch repair ATPase MutS